MKLIPLPPVKNFKVEMTDDECDGVERILSLHQGALTESAENLLNLLQNR